MKMQIRVICEHISINTVTKRALSVKNVVRPLGGYSNDVDTSKTISALDGKAISKRFKASPILLVKNYNPCLLLIKSENITCYNNCKKNGMYVITWYNKALT